MNERFIELLSSLSPEMQEKAKACKNTQELNEFIADNDIELPEDVLDAVAGGNAACNPQRSDPCPEGGDHDWKYENSIPYQGIDIYRCTKCKQTKKVDVCFQW